MALGTIFRISKGFEKSKPYFFIYNFSLKRQPNNLQTMFACKETEYLYVWKDKCL